MGALSVHLVCGIWGTQAVGIFGELAGRSQLSNQFLGILAVGLFCVSASFIILFGLKKRIGLRVAEIDKIEGLDAHEHGTEAYTSLGMNES